MPEKEHSDLTEVLDYKIPNYQQDMTELDMNFHPGLRNSYPSWDYGSVAVTAKNKEKIMEEIGRTGGKVIGEHAFTEEDLKTASTEFLTNL